MVRKQLYLDERQDVALKRRAEELGVSEAEVVRRALDLALAVASRRRWRPGREAAADRLRAVWSAPAGRLVGGLQREELYQERLGGLRRR